MEKEEHTQSGSYEVPAINPKARTNEKEFTSFANLALTGADIITITFAMDVTDNRCQISCHSLLTGVNEERKDAHSK